MRKLLPELVLGLDMIKGRKVRFKERSEDALEIDQITYCLNQNTLKQQFSMWGDLVPQRTLVMSGDSFDCHTGGEGGCDIKWLEARDSAKNPIVHKTAHTTKYSLA